ncbi:MAG: DinB family protein [Vicinamibacterales bacterium]
MTRPTLRSALAATAMAVLLAAPAAAQAPANPVSDAVRASWNGVKKNMAASARSMSEANYAFRPTDKVRSFGEILAHVAGANYVFCAPAKGEKSPFAEDHFEKTATTKMDIAKAVDDSIAYCDQAFAALTDANAREMVAQAFGGGQAPRVATLLGNIEHVAEHYGNLVTYFRLKGLVPPSSAPQ